MTDISEKRRPLIMISNDDSINAPGLLRLVDCVRDFGDVIVVAPEAPHSLSTALLSIASNSAFTPSCRARPTLCSPA